MRSQSSRSLLGRQADPDSRARTHLANERTYLAWFRTGLTVMALGVAAGQLVTQETSSGFGTQRVFAIAVVGAGMALLVVGRRRYSDSRGRIDAAEFVPAADAVNISTALFLLAGVLAVMFLVLAKP